jgi:transketolase N-terminal domain/subunit
MIDMEISLVKSFGWDLHSIDETDIESLLPFVNRFAGVSEDPKPKKVYIDQAMETWFK